MRPRRGWIPTVPSITLRLYCLALNCCGQWRGKTSNIIPFVSEDTVTSSPLLYKPCLYIWYMVCSGLEKEMTTHSSIPAWKILWTKEPGGLQSMGSQRIGHDWVTWAKNWTWLSNLGTLEWMVLSHTWLPRMHACHLRGRWRKWGSEHFYPKETEQLKIR